MENEHKLLRLSFVTGAVTSLVAALFFYIFWLKFILSLIPDKQYFYLAWLPFYSFIGPSFFLKLPLFYVVLFGLFWYMFFGLVMSFYIEGSGKADNLFFIIVTVFLSSPIFSFGSNIIWITFRGLVRFFGYRVESITGLIYFATVVFLIFIGVRTVFQKYNEAERENSRIQKRDNINGFETFTETLKSKFKEKERGKKKEARIVHAPQIEESGKPKDRAKKMDLDIPDFEISPKIQKNEVKTDIVQLSNDAQEKIADKLKRAECPSLRLFVAKGLTYDIANQTLKEIREFLAQELPPRLTKEIKVIWFRYLTCNDVKKGKANKISAQMEIKTTDGTEYAPLFRMHRLVNKWKIHKILYGEDLIILED